MKGSKFIGAVEIGTSKITVLIGEVINGKSLNIISRGESTSMGVTKGEISDIRAVSDCTHAAILAAEKNAGTQIEEVYLSQSGGHLEGLSHSGVTTVSGSDGTVSDQDIRRAIENAKSKALRPGRVYIHHIQSGYLLDGQMVEKPLARQGAQLEAQYWHVHGDERKVSDHIHVINGFGLDVEDIIVSSIASGTILTTETEKRQGVLVVDIGKGTTDYVLYRRGKIVRTGVIPVGGDHVTNDLSLGLRISPKRAESLKIRYGKAMMDKEDKDESVMLVGDLMIGDRPIPRNSIYKIMHARFEELFIILKNRLGSALSSENLPGGVILTGGVSNTHYLAELAESTLGVSAVLGQSPDWVSDTDLRDPSHSTVLGLLYYGLRGQQTEEDIPPARNNGWIRKVADIFR